jgi:hypothetical protein
MNRTGSPTRDEGGAPTEPQLPEPDRDEPTNEPGIDRSIIVEWALWGKETADPEYSVLRCSNGTLDRGDFHEIITRYTSGTKGTLPQYTACWVPDAGNGYLAVAIHELADSDPELSGGRVRASRGREIEYIRLFCVPYGDMARLRANYTDLVESVMANHQLPPGQTDPISVELAVSKSPQPPHEIRALAGNVATLLLTTRPVSVLGADRVTPEDRLRFIDTVMSLLPYGLRATLSASTWASAIARDLKLRLFFTNAERDDGGATSYVTWGQPEQLDLSATESTHLRQYVNWLEHGGYEAAGDLDNLTDPVRFDPDEIRQMVATLTAHRSVSDALEELADGLRHGCSLVVQSAVDRFSKHPAHQASPGERAEYRRAIARLDLFNERQKLPPTITRASLYHALLNLAFAPEITYSDYCEIEDFAGGRSGQALARALLTSKPSLEFASDLAWVLTQRSAAERTDQELMKLLHTQGPSATVLLSEFSRDLGQVRRSHRPDLYNFCVNYLCRDPREARAELMRQGYLTQMLESVYPDDVPAQGRQLERTLRFVHDRPFSVEDVAALNAQPHVQHTVAFETVIERLAASARMTLLGYIRAAWERIHDAKVKLNALVVVGGIAAIFILGYVVGIAAAR